MPFRPAPLRKIPGGGRRERRQPEREEEMGTFWTYFLDFFRPGPEDEDTSTNQTEWSAAETGDWAAPGGPGESWSAPGFSEGSLE